MLVFVYDFMLPGLRNRDIHSLSTETEYRIDVRLERIADHQHLCWNDTEPPAKVRILGTSLLVDHISHIKIVGKA